MSVVSRDAVPLLPMQLARSFAVRTKSEVLRYLANAQFLGLAGLWQKLCAGQLPARCDKAWYFATFCGVDAAEFERKALCELDESADVLSCLNGFVKPYDVVAAMTVLPTTSGWFSADAEVVVNGTAHRLLLRAEHTINVRSVHNLLRETYHSVALLDADTGGSSGSSLVARLLGTRRRASNAAAIHPTGEGRWPSAPLVDAAPFLARAAGRPPPQLRAAAAPALKPSTSPSLGGPPGGPALRSSAAWDRLERVEPPSLGDASARPLRSAAAAVGAKSPAAAMLILVPPPHAPDPTGARAWPAGPSERAPNGGGASGMPRARLNALLRGGSRARALSAHARARALSVALPHGAAIVDRLHAERLRSADGAASHELTAELLSRCVEEAHVRQTVATLRIIALATPVCAGTLVLLLSVLFKSGGGGGSFARDDFLLAREFLVPFGFGVTGNAFLLCLHPSEDQRRRILAVGVLGLGNAAATTIPFALTLGALQPALAADWAPGGARDRARLITAVHAAVHVCTTSLSYSRGMALLWVRRASPQGMIHALWASLIIQYVGSALVVIVALVGRALAGEFSPASRADVGPAAARACLWAAPTAMYALFALFAASPRLQRRVRSLVARPGSGAASAVASLAPLLGYGSADGERDAAKLHAEARRALRGVVLDEFGLDAVGTAWAAEAAARRVAVPPAAPSPLGRLFPLSRYCPRSLAPRHSRHAGASVTDDGTVDGSCADDGRSSLRSSYVSVITAVDDAPVSALPPPAHARRPPPPASLASRQHTKLIASLARANTVEVDAYDCYVVHEANGDARARLAALARYCRQFERSRHRPPVAFVGTLCDLQAADRPSRLPAADQRPAGAHVPTAHARHALGTASDAPRAIVRRVDKDGTTDGTTDGTADGTAAAIAADAIAGAKGGVAALAPSEQAAPPAARRAALSAMRARLPCWTATGGAARGSGVASRAAALRSLEHLPVRMARSSQLLVLASAPLFERLWPTMEIFVWWLTGGGQDMIRVLPVDTDEHESSALLAAVDAFHVMYCGEPRPAERRRIAHLVDIASVPAFNEVVRALYPAVREALARTAPAAEVGDDGDADGAADDEWLGAQWLGRQ
ncbi:hypothetical protein KFE25_002365 [Diacronema lutheri]|uniref:Uncharacterized protein n=1 Tax=Diacronema lutheri TaxID=2081491 RepID=A0A8J5X990_DIALT|nr:hypothetical protein KFE25_002365 [Diacronema lutheri]